MSLLRRNHVKTFITVSGLLLVAYTSINDYRHNHRPLFTDLAQTRDQAYREKVIEQASYNPPVDRHHPLDPNLTAMYGIAHTLAERPLFSEDFRQYPPDTLVEAAERTLHAFWAQTDSAVAYSLRHNDDIRKSAVLRMTWYPREGEDAKPVPFAFPHIDDLLFDDFADLRAEISEGKATTDSFISLDNRLGSYFRITRVGNNPSGLVCSHINDMSQSFGEYLENWADQVLASPESQVILREVRRE